MVLVLAATFNQHLVDTFFTDPNQMNLSARTRGALILERIGVPVDIPNFQKEGINQIVWVLQRPPRATNAEVHLDIQAPFHSSGENQVDTNLRC